MHKKLPAETILPAYERWSALYGKNLRLRQELYGKSFGALVNEGPNEFLALAGTYSDKQRTFAQEHGITLRPFGRRPGSETVLSGHQPIIYHPGITHKLKRASEFAASRAVNAVNMIVDADAVAAGRFYYPKPDAGVLRLQTADLGCLSKVALNQRLKNETEIEETFSPVISALTELDKLKEASGARAALALYKRLAGENLVIANSVVRRALLPLADHLEVPLTEVCGLRSIKSFFLAILRDAEKFARTYNQVLRNHRTSHRIENPANPFPDLKISGNRFELPFWLLDVAGDKRESVFVETKDAAGNLDFSGISIIAGGKTLSLDELYCPGRLLLPKGALNTMASRLLLATFFVHGMGGVKYDVFTDTLIKEYFGIEPPAFTCASASRYLFENEIENYEAAQQRKFEQKEAISHTGKFIGRGYFTSKEEKELAPLIEERKALLERVQDSESSVQRELHEVSSQIKRVVEASGFKKTSAGNAPDEEALRAYYCREYPFFFFLE